MPGNDRQHRGKPEALEMETYTTEAGRNRLASASLAAAGWVCLAAAPVFATMALLTAISSGGSHAMAGPTAHGASPLDGMALMYLLMSLFHTTPWLKRASRRWSGAGGRDPAFADRAAVGTVEGGSHGLEPTAWLPWASSHGSDFHVDFNASFTEEQQRAGNMEYDFRRGDPMEAGTAATFQPNDTRDRPIRRSR